MLEKNFQKAVKSYLNKKTNIYHLNIWGNSFANAGTPDLLICYKGKFIGLELKIKPNKASPLQMAHLKKIEEAGGRGIVFYHSDNWREELDDILAII